MTSLMFNKEEEIVGKKQNPKIGLLNSPLKQGEGRERFHGLYETKVEKSINSGLAVGLGLGTVYTWNSIISNSVSQLLTSINTKLLNTIKTMEPQGYNITFDSYFA